MTDFNSLKIKILLALLIPSTLAAVLAHASLTIPAALSIVAGAGAALWISSGISARLRQVRELADKASQGAADADIDIDSSDEIGRIGLAIKQMAERQKSLIRAATQISQGDLRADIRPQSAQDALAHALMRCQDNLRAIKTEMAQAAEASMEGRLTERCQAEGLQGAYAEVLKSANQILDTLVRPVGKALMVLNNVTNGDLTARIKGDYRGDHAVFQNALNLTIQTLDDALHQVGMAAEQVAGAANQISSGSQTLSQGSSEQAGSIQEVSSSLQEVASMTKQNALNAKEASTLSKVAEESVEAGVDSMRRLSDAITRIKASSDSTAKIIKTIDEIAFQTNLLALNAAVEAARAGDAGKGFAVVAEEVRNLAMRSAEAAKNTATLIEESVRNSENGVALNQEVLKNLSEINDQVRRVGGVMAEIAEASEQQTMGVDQVNIVIQKMSRITQAIASNAEESASGAEELSGQSQELKSMVCAFRLTQKISEGAPFAGESSRAARISGKSAPAKTAGANRMPQGKRDTHSRQSLTAKAEELIPFGDTNLADFRDF